MTSTGGSERWETELRALRAELEHMRSDQQQMATAIRELVTTFRTLATHLGIAAEPYVRKDANRRDPDVPGFG